MNTTTPAQHSNESSKWKLAEHLSSTHTGPDIFLRQLFEGVLIPMKQLSKTEITPEITERVWAKVSEARLKELRMFYINEISIQILSAFSDEQALKMLKEIEKYRQLATQSFLLSCALQILNTAKRLI